MGRQQSWKQHTISKGEIYPLSHRQHNCLSSLGGGFENSLWPGMCWNSSSASFPGCISNPRVPGSV